MRKESIFVFAALLLSQIAFAVTTGGAGSAYAVSCAIAPSVLSLQVEGTAPLSISCEDVSGAQAACPDMAWSSTIGSISASPSVDGVTFFALTSSGSGEITARSPEFNQPTFSCSISVSVLPGAPARLDATPDSTSVNVGSSTQFYANLYDEYGNLIPSGTAAEPIAWSTTGKYGEVNQNGLYTGKSAGTDSVTATYSGITGTRLSDASSVTVVAQNPTRYCDISPSSASVQVEGTQKFTVNCHTNDPTLANDIVCPTMLWSVTEGKITPDPAPSINGQTATFTAGKYAKEVIVNAYEDSPSMCPGCTISCIATVNVVPGPAANVEVFPTSASLYVGDKQQFSALVTDQYGNQISDAGISWSTTGSAGTVDQTGRFTATAAGSSTVRAEAVSPSLSAPFSTASVAVSNRPSGSGGTGGGSGGSNSGGGSFSSSSTVSFTCAGEPASLSVKIFRQGASALAELYYLEVTPHTKVFSKNVSSDQVNSISFDKNGEYELRVTVGTEQRNANFYVPLCTPATINITKNITIELQGEGNQTQNRTIVPQKEAPKPGPGPSQEANDQIAGIPTWVLVAVAIVLVLAAAYFLVFGKKN